MRVADKIELKDKSKELFDYLVNNKSQIIKTKCSEPIKSAPLMVDSSLEFFKKNPTVIKAEGEEAEELDSDSLFARVVANATMFCDHDMDVLIPGCYDETIKNDKQFMVQIHDHLHSVVAKVAKVLDVKAEQVSLQDLGIKNMTGSTQVLVFENRVLKKLNETVFYLYKYDEANQHSIGLRYIKIELAIDDEDYKQEYSVWQKYSGGVINQQKIQQRGYFWAVEEIKVLENSVVLFGSNELTPTLEVSDEDKSKEVEVDEKTEDLQNQTKSNWELLRGK